MCMCVCVRACTMTSSAVHVVDFSKPLERRKCCARLAYVTLAWYASNLTRSECVGVLRNTETKITKKNRTEVLPVAISTFRRYV
ncbi:hypothetical protein PUN28_017426 [Cardiocondyla obscurior]|uniref:Secreted protein n=1 Tax=Cardiocondyla obscurior TaxID=286306 RepID=A0AAW2EQK3_9HYME